MTSRSPYPSVEQVVRNLGYRSTDDFVHIQLRNVLEQKVAYYQSRIDYFQQKYGMTFEEFRRRVIDKHDPLLARYSLAEKEHDDNDWDDAIDFLDDYVAYLQQI